MAAGGDAAEPDQRAKCQSAGNRRLAPPSERQQECETHQREAERRMPRDKGAIAFALRRRQRCRREPARAAEGLDLVGPRASPMVLEQGVGDQPGAERRRHHKKDQRLAVEPPQRSADQDEPGGGNDGDDDHQPDQPRHRAFDQAQRRPVGEEKSGGSVIEHAAHREVDARHGQKQRGNEAAQPGVKCHPFHPRRRCSSRASTLSRNSAPARAVSSGGT